MYCGRNQSYDGFVRIFLADSTVGIFGGPSGDDFGSCRFYGVGNRQSGAGLWAGIFDGGGCFVRCDHVFPRCFKGWKSDKIDSQQCADWFCGRAGNFNIYIAAGQF